MQTVLSASAMTECDRAECQRTPSRLLMRRAGEAIYSIIKNKSLPPPYAIVCGTGNNAGDGFVIAHCLALAGNQCKIFLTCEKFSPDGFYYFQACKNANIPFEICGDLTDFSNCGTVVDCIFGVGFHGSLNPFVASIVDKINNSGAFVLSVDINSGLDANSGLSNKCVHSDLTVAIAFYKYGHFLGMAKDVMREKMLVDIGIPLSPNVTPALLPESFDFSTIIKKRPNYCNKGDFGTVTILGGCNLYSGAVKLANLSCSALKSGCGIARVACPASLQTAILPYLLESTFFPLKDKLSYAIFDKDALDFILSHSNAVALGMGWGNGEDNLKILLYLLQNSKIPLVIDADGLNALSKTDLAVLRLASCPVILTPHPKEFSRLSGKSVPEILDSPVSCAIDFARSYNVTLLLKGTSTVITDGNTTFICDKGCPGMASAGSGDVLSGIIVGLLGYAPPSPLTVSCAAFISGLAGMLAENHLNSVSTVASDTVSYIPEAVSSILNASPNMPLQKL